ncbi:hypothetical protein [Streptomyces griseiscabiei]|uniref:Uncharacterized protein n=1 Tax=Streptomyces griseiscabiei TaxID=2993540 RepID=A0ABU4LDC7_9ACTN|nr:hypothetical protein [Streptomyces griseiscabiei]MBZ3906712.1 hypothetical protein [Streptomyces griseiscabiei]MDX2913777.1 hypothetical protein [Streptomyces griseiscabiei]
MTKPPQPVPTDRTGALLAACQYELGSCFRPATAGALRCRWLLLTYRFGLLRNLGLHLRVIFFRQRELRL